MAKSTLQKDILMRRLQQLPLLQPMDSSLVRPRCAARSPPTSYLLFLNWKTGIIRNFTIDYSSLLVPINMGDFARHPANGLLYFTVAEPQYGVGIWSTDGSTAQIAVNSIPGPGNTIPTELQPFNGTHIIFVSIGPTLNFTLWALSSSNTLTRMVTLYGTLRMKGDVDLQQGAPGYVGILSSTRNGREYDPTRVTIGSGSFSTFKFVNLTSYTTSSITLNTNTIYPRGVVAGNTSCTFNSQAGTPIVCSSIGGTPWSIYT
jgi:ELWxxDGT repeat protein